MSMSIDTTQHGHLSRAVSACSDAVTSLLLVARPLTDGNYPVSIQHVEPTNEWFAGAYNLYSAKREQKVAIT